jgi:two-component system, NtrC family, response regulator AtoC
MGKAPRSRCTYPQHEPRPYRDYYVRTPSDDDRACAERPRVHTRTVRRTVLIVDDEQDTAELLAEILQLRGYTTIAVGSAEECIERLEREVVDVVLTDVMLPGVSGIDLCKRLRTSYPDVLALVVTGRSNFDMAIEAIRAGAYDYIAKPVKINVLEIALIRAFEHLELRREVARLRTVIQTDPINGVAGESPVLMTTLDLVHRVAPSDATVLVTGESGSGKELVARALHHLSPRRDQPFVAINCAAMPVSLMESELFGHVRGAFTDASSTRTGLFVQAGRGTIFLDELGEMPLEMQVKLLRVLQERTLRAVGSDTEVPFAARVIASTNRDLEAEVKLRRFREDLFYRINVVSIVVPPLRDRGRDVLLIAQYFLRKIAARVKKPVEGITPAAAKLLMQYDWPGNVRELENCMERAVALCRLDQITTEDLPQRLHHYPRGSAIPVTLLPNELITLAEMERRYVRQVVSLLGGNKTRAARALGIDRRSVYRRLDLAEPSAALDAAGDQ